MLRDPRPSRRRSAAAIRRLVVVTGAALAAGAVATGSAGAALTVTASPGTIVLTGDAASEIVTLTRRASGDLLVTNGSGAITPGPGCAAAVTGVTCPTAGVALVQADLGAGPDDLTVIASADPAAQPDLPVDVAGGAGDDRLTGGTAADALDGGSGADELSGGAGDDRLDDADGESDGTATCGDGTDVLAFDPPIGGLGGDDQAATTGCETATATSVVGSVAGQDADGIDPTLRLRGAPGSPNDVSADRGDGPGGDPVWTLRDPAGIGVADGCVHPTPDDLTVVRCIASSDLDADLGDGDDTFALTRDLDPSGSISVRGGPGADLIVGGEQFAGAGRVQTDLIDQRLDGGPGDDDVRGGFGDDVLVGGAGNDRLDGGEGRDTFDAGSAADAGGADTFVTDDGLAERATCRPSDRVRADPLDDLAGACRSVRRGDSTAPRTAKPALRLRIRRATRQVGYTVTCPPTARRGCVLALFRSSRPRLDGLARSARLDPAFAAVTPVAGVRRAPGRSLTGRFTVGPGLRGGALLARRGGFLIAISRAIGGGSATRTARLPPLGVRPTAS